MSGSLPGRFSKTFWLQTLALLTAAAAVVVSLAYSNRQIERLRDQTRSFTRSYAELISFVATDTSASSSQLDIAISHLIAQYDFPYVVTDTFGTPLASSQFEPIPLEVPGAPQIFHYGDPPSVRRLRILPYIQLGLLAFVLLLVWWSLKSGLARQRSLVWVGLARESAHQFGTPLSSLQGWMILLGEQLNLSGRSRPESEDSQVPDIEEIMSAMEDDVERMVRVTSRFAKIGGRAGAGSVDLVKVVGGVVDYMRGRAPQRAANVIFTEDYGSPPDVLGQEELLEWVVENLLKNALDALGGKSGEIRIQVMSDDSGQNAVLRVEDTGKGMVPADQRHIFDAGFSRKRRGWGLGLTLSKRLVEEFGGRLYLIRSVPGEGTLFEAVLPAADKETD